MLDVIVFDVNERVFGRKQIEDQLIVFYELIGCRAVDIVTRSIGGKYYDIVCDDEGLFAESPVVSAVDDDGSVMFVGNLIICGMANDEGELTSLDDDDFYHIMEHIGVALDRRKGKAYPVITEVGY